MALAPDVRARQITLRGSGERQFWEVFQALPWSRRGRAVYIAPARCDQRAADIGGRRRRIRWSVRLSRTRTGARIHELLHFLRRGFCCWHALGVKV